MISITNRCLKQQQEQWKNKHHLKPPKQIMSSKNTTFRDMVCKPTRLNKRDLRFTKWICPDVPGIFQIINMSLTSLRIAWDGWRRQTIFHISQYWWIAWWLSMPENTKITWKKTLHPWKLTWNLKITCLKRKIIFQTFIFRFHVNFRGCKQKSKNS